MLCMNALFIGIFKISIVNLNKIQISVFARKISDTRISQYLIFTLIDKISLQKQENNESC